MENAEIHSTDEQSNLNSSYIGETVFITSCINKQCLASNEVGDVYSNSNRLQWECWHIVQSSPDENTVFIINATHNTHLKTLDDGGIHSICTPFEGESMKWIIDRGPDDRIYLRCSESDRILTCIAGTSNLTHTFNRGQLQEFVIERAFNTYLEGRMVLIVSENGRHLSCNAEGHIRPLLLQGDEERWCIVQASLDCRKVIIFNVEHGYYLTMKADGCICACPANENSSEHWDCEWGSGDKVFIRSLMNGRVCSCGDDETTLSSTDTRGMSEQFQFKLVASENCNSDFIGRIATISSLPSNGGALRSSLFLTSNVAQLQPIFKSENMSASQNWSITSATPDGCCIYLKNVATGRFLVMEGLRKGHKITTYHDDGLWQRWVMEPGPVGTGIVHLRSKAFGKMLQMGNRENSSPSPTVYRNNMSSFRITVKNNHKY